MKYVMHLRSIFLFSLLVVASSACSDDDEKPAEPLEATTATDVNSVSTKNFTLFSFANNATVSNADSATTQWDIGFRGTTIILNGGVSGPGMATGQTVDGIFDELMVAPAAGYSADADGTLAIVGSGGWYTYTGTASVPNHAILPVAGKILVLKTADEKFVKVEILSYYLGNPSTTTDEFADLATRPESRYYTFRYTYQPDGTTNLETTSE